MLGVVAGAKTRDEGSKPALLATRGIEIRAAARTAEEEHRRIAVRNIVTAETEAGGGDWREEGLRAIEST